MNLALFGGSFDPLHHGHLAAAQAALEQFKLGTVHFVLAETPPHKKNVPLSPFPHRYAMLSLGLAGEKRFVPSLLEARSVTDSAPVYSIDTVRRFKARLGKRDRLFFIVGADSFLGLSGWRQPEDLLREVEFIVVSRPGFSLADVGRALPENLRPGSEVMRLSRRLRPSESLRLAGGIAIHFLPHVNRRVSATDVRNAAAAGRSLSRFVPASVAEYIRKTGLYAGERNSTRGKNASPARRGQVLQFRQE